MSDNDNEAAAHSGAAQDGQDISVVVELVYSRGLDKMNGDDGHQATTSTAGRS
jgi:hypothetical protein